MTFIRLQDYLPSIKEDTLNQILFEARSINGDAEVLAMSEDSSISRAKEYLRSRYKVDRIFKGFVDFDIANDYTYGDLIDWTATDYVASVYTSGTLLLYNGVVYQKNAYVTSYTSLILPTNATYFDNRGEEGTYYIAYPQDWDEDTLYVANDLVFYSHEVYKKNATVGGYLENIAPTNTAYFERIKTVEYPAELTVTGVYPNNASWTFGDNRNQNIIDCIVSMVLSKIHAIINPRNIPAVRTTKYSEAITLLKEYQKGMVEADLPDRQLNPLAGYSIRAGSNTPTEHGY